MENMFTQESVTIEMGTCSASSCYDGCMNGCTGTCYSGCKSSDGFDCLLL